MKTSPKARTLRPMQLKREQLAALRRIAVDLIGDSHLAEDAVQHTQIQAARGAPTHPAARRSWLRTVTRNQATKLAQRERREEAARLEAGQTRTRTSPATDERVSRDELHALVQAAIEELPDSYAACIRLRYEDGLSPRVIAAQLEIPVATVHSRIRRGLAAMRVDLDRRAHGDVWRGALIACVPVKRGAAAIVIATLFVATLAFVLGGGAFGDGPSAPALAAGLPANTGEERFRLEDGARAKEIAEDKEAKGLRRDAQPAKRRSVVRTRPPMAFRVFVHDERGAPIAGARVFRGGRFTQSNPHSPHITDEYGKVTITTHKYSAGFYATAPGFCCSRRTELKYPPPAPAPARPANAPRTMPFPLTVRIAMQRGGMRIAGRVGAIAGAGRPQIVLIRSLHALAQVDESGEGLPILAAAVDDDGRFAIDGVAPGACELVVRTDEYDYTGSARIEGRAGDVHRVYIPLKPCVDTELLILETDGRPVAEARVDAPSGISRLMAARTDVSGIVQLEELAVDGGTCPIRVATRDGRTHEFTLRFDRILKDRAVEFRMPPARRARVEVLLPKASDEVFDALSIEYRDPATGVRRLATSSSETRRYVLEDCPERVDLRLIEEEMGLAHAHATAVDTRGGSIVLPWRAKPVVSVRCSDFVRPPALRDAIFYVRLHDARGCSQLSRVSAESFEVIDVPPGSYRIELQSPLLPAIDLGPVTVPENPRKDVELGTHVLRAPGSVILAKSRESGAAKEGGHARRYVLRDARKRVVARWTRRTLPGRIPLAAGDYEMELPHKAKSVRWTIHSAQATYVDLP